MCQEVRRLKLIKAEGAKVAVVGKHLLLRSYVNDGGGNLGFAELTRGFDVEDLSDLERVIDEDLFFNNFRMVSDTDFKSGREYNLKSSVIDNSYMFDDSTEPRICDVVVSDVQSDSMDLTITIQGADYDHYIVGNKYNYRLWLYVNNFIGKKISINNLAAYAGAIRNQDGTVTFVCHYVEQYIREVSDVNENGISQYAFFMNEVYVQDIINVQSISHVLALVK